MQYEVQSPFKIKKEKYLSDIDELLNIQSKESLDYQPTVSANNKRVLVVIIGGIQEIMEIEKLQESTNSHIQVSNIIKKNNYLCDKYYTKKQQLQEDQNWIFTPEVEDGKSKSRI